MAAFTATDWAVTVQDEWIEGGKRHTRCLLSATVGSTSATSGIIAAPTAAQLGMRRNVDFVILTDPLLATDGSRLIKYDQANHQFKVFTTTASSGTSITELASAGAVTGTVYVEVVGW